MIKDQQLEIRACTTEDVDRVRQFVSSCAPLELHTAFTYWVMFEHWGDLCFVVLEGNQIVGYISAIGSGRHKDTIYLWQIGIADELRGRGLAQRLIAATVDAAIDRGYRAARVSIAPDNEMSLKALERFATSRERRLARSGALSFRDSLSGNSVQEICFELELSPEGN